LCEYATFEEDKPKGGKMKKVLIVTDDFKWGEEIGKELRQRGYEIRLTSQHGIAVVTFVRFNPDLTLITGPEGKTTLSPEWRQMVRVYTDIKRAAHAGQKILRSDCLPMGYVQFEAELLLTYLE